MCIYNQLKKILKNMCNPPPPRGVNGAPIVLKLYASGGINITKSIEGGSIKLTTLVDYIYIYIYIYIYVCAALNECPCNESIYYFFFI